MTAVVVIDDSPEDRELLTEMAFKAGAVSCNAFADPEAAIQHVEVNGADVFLIDFQLEGEVGLARIPRLRRHAPNAQVVVVTGREFYGLSNLIDGLGVEFLPKNRIVKYGLQHLSAFAKM